jgi:H3 lysine-79-specific histone-lysine N-methyltransferase
VDDMSSIFDVAEREFHSGHVSWMSGGGKYYVHRVDRVGYASARARFERSGAGRRAASSYKWTPSNLAD